jgi:uncharacterized membrane-anchored protein
MTAYYLRALATQVFGFGFSLILLTAALSQEAAEERTAEEQAQAEKAALDRMEALGWKREGVGDLQGRATIAIPAGFRFTEGSGTGKLLEMFGNLASGRELGMLTTEGFGPWIIFEFADTGYVKDDEKDELDADSLLKTLREGQAYGNERRREMGLEELELVGWAVPPKYNIETNNLEWGTIVRSASGGDSVNYNTRLLGRRGVMEVALVCSPDELQALLPQYQSILAGYDYIDGERYAEFRQGDRMAQYGLTALVAGGAAVAASKMGLFAKFGAFFAKLGKGAILLVVAAGVGLKKLLGKLLGARQDPTQP